LTLLNQFHCGHLCPLTVPSILASRQQPRQIVMDQQLAMALVSLLLALAIWPAAMQGGRWVLDGGVHL